MKLSLFRSRPARAGLAAVFALSLGACSASSGDDAGDATSADGKTTISWWSWNPDAAAAVEYVDAFEAANPDVTVEYRFIAYSDWVNTLRLAVTSDSGPDVFGLQVGSMTEQFAPLAADLTQYATDSIGADYADQVTATDQLNVDGRQVGMPWMVTGGGLLWANQTLLDSKGLAAPTTLAELKTACAAVKADGISCVAQGGRDAWVNLDVYQTVINQLKPGVFYDALNGDASFTDPEFVQAFEIWKSFFDDGIFQEGALATAQYPDAVASYIKGEAAFTILGTWNNSATTKAALGRMLEEHGVAAITSTEYLPTFFPAVTPDATTGLLFGGPDLGWGISEASKKKDAAWKLVDFLVASEEGQTIVARTVQQPALQSVPLDLSDVTTDAQVAALEAQGPALAKMVGPRQISNADVETALGDALSAVAAGTQSPADAADAVQAVIDAAQK